MSYFKTSFATLSFLAAQGHYEDVAGFLVLARHAHGRAVGPFGPYRLSGAGVNAIHEKVGMCEAAAREVIGRLQGFGVIRPASSQAKQAFVHARWEIVQGPLDLALPHNLIDPAVGNGFDPALRRITKQRSSSPRKNSNEPDEMGQVSARLDSLMTLLAVYSNTSMSIYGGLSPACVRRDWDVNGKFPVRDGIHWDASPSDKQTTVWGESFIRDCLNHGIPQSPSSLIGTLSTKVRERFRAAWGFIHEHGLIYETVGMYNQGREIAEAELWYTLRVNDYHAGSMQKSGDPSLLREMEIKYANRFAFYTPAINPTKKRESLWVILPDDLGILYGIWRPRFRAAVHDVGLWISQEKDRISRTLQAVENYAERQDANMY